MNSEVLRELGLDSKSSWMLYDDSAQKTFLWIANNLGIHLLKSKTSKTSNLTQTFLISIADHSNILTDQELIDFKAIVSAGLFKTGDSLAEDLESLEREFPGISKSDEEIESEILKLQRELRFVESDNNERKNRILRMQETSKAQQQKLAEMEIRSRNLDCEDQFLLEKCHSKGKHLEELQSSNFEQSQELKKALLEPVKIKHILFD